MNNQLKINNLKGSYTMSYFYYIPDISIFHLINPRSGNKNYLLILEYYTKDYIRNFDVIYEVEEYFIIFDYKNNDFFFIEKEKYKIIEYSETRNYTLLEHSKNIIDELNKDIINKKFSIIMIYDYEFNGRYVVLRITSDDYAFRYYIVALYMNIFKECMRLKGEYSYNNELKSIEIAESSDSIKLHFLTDTFFMQVKCSNVFVMKADDNNK